MIGYLDSVMWIALALGLVLVSGMNGVPGI